MSGIILWGIAGGLCGCLGGVMMAQGVIRGDWLLALAGIGLMFSVGAVQGLRLLWFDYKHGMGWFS